MTITGVWKIGIPLTALVVHWGVAVADESRFEIDLKELPKAAAPPAKRPQPQPSVPRRPAHSPAKAKAQDGALRHYTVKPGDHIFKILMRDFGLSNQQAEQLIPDVARLNGLSDIRRLRVGQELLIPLTPSRSARKPEEKGTAKRASVHEPSRTGAAPAEEPAPRAEVRPTEAEPASVQPTPAVSAPEAQIAPSPVPPPEPQVAPVAPPAPIETPSAAAPAPAKPERIAVRPVNARDRDAIVDAVLDLLAPGWTRNRIVEGGRQSTDGSYVSIKVGRYFEYRGNRYIVNCENDPLTLTLLRLLEVQGDRVINISPDEAAPAIAGRLAAKMELPQQERSFRVKCLDPPEPERSMQGVLIAPAGPYGQQFIITGDQVPACTAELLTAQ